MWLLQLARKNMWRNAHRTVITMTAVFFAVVLSVLASSLKEGIFDNLVRNLVSYYTGYIQIHQKGYWEERTLDNSFSLHTPQLQQILSAPHVSAATPRLETFALASFNDLTKGCLVTGIDPQREDQVTSLKQKLIRGQYFLSGKPSVLLAEGLAERLRIQPGDTLYLIGQGYHASTAAGKYTVAGIVKFGSPEINRGSLFLPVQDAQNLFSCPERLTSLVIMLEDNQQLQEAKQVLTQLLPDNYEVMTWEEMLPEVKQHIETDSNNMRYVQFILYLLICFGIFGTLLMMMMERKYEMGMLVAIGMKKNLLAIVVTLESLFTVIVGCLLGLLASAPLVAYFHLHPIRMGGNTAKAYERFGFEAIFPTSTDPRLFWEQGLTVLVLGLVLSLYPVYKVFRIEPVTSMKR